MPDRFLKNANEENGDVGRLTETTILGRRRYVPFDVFAMRVDVPVSSMVRDGDLGWTCGQCPLDRRGDVVAPFDLTSQAGFVCDMIEATVERAGFTRASVGKLNVYVAETAAWQGDQALAAIKARFDHQPVIVPIPVPHFYYDGMMLEIDIFTGPRTTCSTLITGRSTKLHIADAGEVAWASVAADVARHASLSDCLSEIASTLDGQGLAIGNKLADHWFLSCETTAVPATRKTSVYVPPSRIPTLWSASPPINRHRWSVSLHFPEIGFAEFMERNPIANFDCASGAAAR